MADTAGRPTDRRRDGRAAEPSAPSRRSMRSCVTSPAAGSPGILVGIFVAGLGGRLVMRLATILHEDTVGRMTENGEP